MQNTNMDNHFQHILITRFNVKATRITKDKNQKPVLTDDWMKKRLKLFSNYCLPSIANQTCKNFKWLIYFDSETKPEYKQKLAELHQQFPIFYSKYVIDAYQLFDHLKTDVLSFTDQNTKFLITTRLDNDDALHKEAIARIQKEFSSVLNSNNNTSLSKSADLNGKKILINLKNGFCLKIEPRYELTHYSHSSNPFISMIEILEGNQKISTVLSEWHDNFLNQKDKYKVVQINDGHYWMQIIHSSNVVNNVTGWPFMRVDVVSDFGLEPSSISFNRTDYTGSFMRKLWQSFRRRLNY
ncbi:glycosyltransferase [Leptolyngbya sp. 7M]|uniref:glycosyltransferase n=1 Tax=Leptolyngbya sp. 7M TaxID=2812896 RepID=UPI001B8C473C|nr:glycosyltransferase [Leptolyngbya sp. 7M]QYO63849.1 putative rhamnosyl transferase [Leptolyngbya sp. 7M]